MTATVSLVVLCTLHNYIQSKCIPIDLVDLPVETCEI